MTTMRKKKIDIEKLRTTLLSKCLECKYALAFNGEYFFCDFFKKLVKPKMECSYFRKRRKPYILRLF